MFQAVVGFSQSVGDKRRDEQQECKNATLLANNHSDRRSATALARLQRIRDQGDVRSGYLKREPFAYGGSKLLKC